MRRGILIVLCVCLLWGLGGCHENGGTQEWPQVGVYAETVYLAGTAGQAALALLSVRGDGTVDYIFCGGDVRSDGSGELRLPSPAEAEFQYCTIGPGGQVTVRETDWVEQLDALLTADSSAGDPGWTLRFSACEGNILILARPAGDGVERKTALYRLEEHRLTELSLPRIGETEGDLQVYAAGEGFLVLAGDAKMGYLVSYDGRLLAQRSLPEDALSRLVGIGSGTAWFVNARRDRLTAIRLSDLSEISADSVEPAAVPCGAATPDGSAVYFLWSADGSSRIQLSRFRQAGEEVLIADASFYAFGNPETVPARLAVAQDGVFYTWTAEDGQGVLRQYRDNPAGARSTRRRTVCSLEDSPAVRTAVSRWNRTHTDITFQYLVAAQETGGTVEDAMDWLRDQLTGGAGPDVLILEGLPADSRTEWELLRPLPELDGVAALPPGGDTEAGTAFLRLLLSVHESEPTMPPESRPYEGDAFREESPYQGL